MIEFRYFAATFMLLMSIVIIVLNGLVVIRISREREGFHKICANKAFANVLIALAFLIWAAPCSYLNQLYLPEQFNVFFGLVVGWGPYLISGPFTQICLAVNRAVAISYPYWFKKQHKVSWMTFVLAGLWTLAILISIPAMIDGCSYIFFVENVSWSSTDSYCSRTLSEYLSSLVLVMAVISFSINISSIVKIVRSTIGLSAVMDQNVSNTIKGKRRKMFIQCVIQDCTHTTDCMMNTYIYSYSSAKWFQFMCGAVSALSVLLLDGLVPNAIKREIPNIERQRTPMPH